MKILLYYLQRYKWLVLLTFILAIINQSFSLLDPYIFGKIFDDYATHPHTKIVDGKQFSRTSSEFIKGVLFLIACAISVAMISRIAKAFQDYCMNVVIQRFGADVYTDGLKHALQLPFQAFEDQRSGETLNILQKVRQDSERFMQNFINVLFVAVIGIVFVIIYSAFVYPGLILMYFIASFLLGTSINILSKKIKTVQATITQKTNILAGATTESLRNIELIKSLGLTQQEVNRLNDTTLKILNLELDKVKKIRSISFVQGTLVNSLRQVIMFIILMLIFKDHLTAGQLITLQFYSFFIFNPLQEMGNVIMSYREAEASLKNFEKLMNTAVERKPQVALSLHAIESLSFDNVGFQHQSATTNAIEHISFTAKKGDTIAFVGPSGAGKTTLVKLLVGLYQAQSGKILYNNLDAENIDIEELRAQIGFVTQDTQLFAGTIKENLLFVNPSASDDEIYDVLNKSACQSLLARSDNGINTVIGEGGMKISGGEKQRLSIARALLRQPKIMVFDEATSALDSITENEITQTIKNLISKKEHITVMIAHRLSTIMHADTIYVLEKGKIIESGNHQHLLAEKGLYYAMWRQQIGERER
ncbi:MAG TPA: ABC transporter ATP-binding protein [Chitinophagales bacterium]|nr:ABC transporter ATP-binding protein [Chitinophagales bacterium]HMW13790.1 ABC transporter ATP-binding protein [Chitinophagales bacterium]HMX61205.1 ABC transporter ATP-binding protein [Chitinophagales bacterium]HMZ34812.1 ABC transporter ATP-binding protein [Chitinophagales bacterium]HNA39648.1 ABC transporter ATP-binding protein [Chitinophagales bacterium]